MQTDLQAIVLAAGKSSRMHSGNSKLLEKICGQELILYSTRLLKQLHIPTTFVVGHQKEPIIACISTVYPEAVFVEQHHQRGTGHALLVSQPTWRHDHLLVLNADVPLLTAHLLQEIEEKHAASRAAITFVTSYCDPSNKSYGRIVNKEGVLNIIEARELSEEDLAENCCMNAGIYLIARSFAEQAIAQLKPNQSSNELYITDLIRMAQEQGLSVATVNAAYDTIRGVNTFEELWVTEQIQRSALLRHWMERGVRFMFPQNTGIDLGVSVGPGTIIGAGVQLRGKTTIGSNCIIDAFSVIDGSSIENHATIHPHSVITNSIVQQGVSVGPFAYLREHTILKDHSTIGSFVEVKKSTIGEHTKAKHLSYLGDATIGIHVNIGAGTIICNHDGVKKHKTLIEDYAYIGSNNSIVAPAHIGKYAFTGAGSVITEPVPAHALALARARQVNKHEYAKKLRNRTAEKSEPSQDTGSPSTAFIGAKKIDKGEFSE